MSGTTTIEWAEKSWNPVRGCSIVSPGCTNCYAMKFAHRFSAPGGPYEDLTRMTKGGPVWTGNVTTHPELLDWPIRRRKPSRIFVNSMSDLFHEAVPDIFIADVFAAMAYARHHTFQVLTKRADRMQRMLNSTAFADLYDTACAIAHDEACEILGRRGEFDPNARHTDDIRAMDPELPRPNIWLGVSVEDQVRAYERIPMLLQTPAAVRWISAEPLLGQIDLRDAPNDCGEPRFSYLEHVDGVGPRIDWVVAGGESGPGARPSHPDWHRGLRDQCAAADVPFFFKQWGNHLPGEINRGEPTLRWQDGRTEWYGDHADIKYQKHWLTNDDTGLVVAWPTAKKAAGRMLDGRTHDEYPA